MTTDSRQPSCGITPGESCGCAGGSVEDAAFRWSAFTKNERLTLLAATAVVIGGIAAAAVNPSPLDAAPKVAAQSQPPHASCPTTPTSAGATTTTASSATSAPATVSATGASAGTSARTAVSRQTTEPRRPAARTKPAPKTTQPAVSPTPAPRYVSFGSFEGAPLKWRVLAENDDELLLLSEYVLSAGAFESDWETADASAYGPSEIRAWLRTRFAPAAFSAEESAALLPHAGGAASGDAVFLLDAAETTRYLSAAVSRQAAPGTAAATGAAGYSGEALAVTRGFSAWWLADAGSQAGTAKYVGSDGVLGSQLVYYADLGVRPAIRVDRTKAVLTPAAGTD